MTANLRMDSFTYNSKNAFANFETDQTLCIRQPQTETFCTKTASPNKNLMILHIEKETRSQKHVSNTEAEAGCV